MSESLFEKKIKPILLYVGTIGAVLMSIGYVVLMFVLVLGFKADKTFGQAVVFAVINAIVGFIIMQFLKIQGIDFAKLLSENTKVMKKYNEVSCTHCLSKKERKAHSLKYFWTKTLISDALIKALMTMITTAGIIYIVIEGSQDYNMLLLSVVNLLLFACFGLLSLVKAYDFYNDQYIPYIQQCISNPTSTYYENKQPQPIKNEEISIEGDILKEDVYIETEQHN